MKTRFAPSPTGWMHFGNFRTALFNFLFANKQKYDFLLRIEDTDQARSTKEYQLDILEDLKWMGLTWSEGPYYQSERAAIYNNYYRQLEDQHLAYPCFCSEETLGVTRKLQAAAGQPPRYPGTCRNLSKEVVAQRLQAGETATLRFLVPRDQIIEFVDLVKGPQRFAANDIGDFIIRRNDGSASFMFCNAIDDAEMSVTHALRGDDHLANTPRQLMILKALNLPAPQYGHFAMINGSDGTPLSKRNGSQAVRDLRAQGYLPLAVLNYIARLGHYYASNDFLSLEQLEQQFDLAHISTSPARHDISHLRHWQKEALMRCDNSEISAIIKPYLNNTIPEAKLAEFSELVKDNILMPSDVTIWVDAVTADSLNFSDADLEILNKAGAEFFAAALNAVKSNPKITFKELADQVKEHTGAKGKELFMPLRIALTGQSHGPELAKLMAFMSSELIANRFENVRIKCI
jgi:glutamyl-tRNA synthetase